MSLGNPGRFSSHDNDKRLDSGPHPVSLSVLHFPCNVNGNRSFLTSHEVAGSDFASCHPSTIFIRYSFTYNCKYDMTTITDKYPRYKILGINQSPLLFSKLFPQQRTISQIEGYTGCLKKKLFSEYHSIS